MQRIFSFLVWGGLATAVGIGRPSHSGTLVYQSPLPGAQFVRRETNIIVRPGGAVDAASVVSTELFDVGGSRSGWHAGRAMLSDDGRTVLFAPSVPFSAGETVTVHFAHGIRLADGEVLTPTGFSFCVADSVPLERPMYERSPAEVFGFPRDAYPGAPENEPGRIARTDTLPLDFPLVRTTLFGTPGRGRLFLGNTRFVGPFIPYLMILDDAGNPVFYRKMQGWCTDFKLQPGGLLTYYDTYVSGFVALDSTYAVVDTFFCGNGYSLTFTNSGCLLTDTHFSWEPTPRWSI